MSGTWPIINDVLTLVFHYAEFEDRTVLDARSYRGLFTSG